MGLTDNPIDERFIRPMGLRYKKCHVTHKELGVTVQLPIISVKKVCLYPVKSSGIHPSNSLLEPAESVSNSDGHFESRQ